MCLHDNFFNVLLENTKNWHEFNDYRIFKQIFNAL